MEGSAAFVDSRVDGALIVLLDLLMVEEDLLEQSKLEGFGGSEDCGVSDEDR